MRKRIIIGFVMMIGSTLLVAPRSSRAESVAESTPPTVAGTSPVAAASADSSLPTTTVVATEQGKTKTRRAFSYGRVRRSASRNSGGPTNYNYSGVGFPRMEGGLTAAANRTTWLKPMNTPRRRGR